MRRNTLCALASAGLAAATAPSASGHETDPSMDRVSFSVEATEKVENNWLAAVVGVTEEGSDVAELADRVNRSMTWALDTARAVEHVQVKSGSYYTSPVYDRGVIRRWRASQDLVLEGSDAARLTRLIGELQSRLALRSIAFSVSPERRREVEAELIQRALSDFRARADLVRESLERRGYAIVQISINTGGGAPVVPLRARAQALAVEAVAPPALEGGSSTVRISVSGTIELE